MEVIDTGTAYCVMVVGVTHRIQCVVQLLSVGPVIPLPVQYNLVRAAVEDEPDAIGMGVVVLVKQLIFVVAQVDQSVVVTRSGEDGLLGGSPCGPGTSRKCMLNLTGTSRMADAGSRGME